MFNTSPTNISERAFLGSMLQLFRKPERLSTKDYAETYRWLTSDVTANPGKMNCMETPFMLYPMECMDDLDKKIIVGQKSAQIAWSETTNSYMSKRMHIDPQNILVAFPRMESAKKYSREKIVPMIKSNPYLLETIGNPARCSYKFFKFHGGWLSLITARSTEDLKSSSAPIILVEEPDGLQCDVGNQVDALDLLSQRQKTYPERKLIYAGTPTDAGFSRVALAYKQSNQMVYQVPCRSCGTLQTFNFNQLKCDQRSSGNLDEIYGKWNPKSAYYECIHCAAIWDDADRKQAVINALNYNNLGWFAQRPEEKDITGFAFNELMSSFSASTHVELMQKKVKAELALARGEEGLMKSFTNNSMGEAYETKSTGVDLVTMRSRRQVYPEGIVPISGVVLTMGIDVQHNRFAVVIRAWGRNNCSWLVSWKEIFGNVLDPEDAVWGELTDLYLAPILHAAKKPNGAPIYLNIDACSIDCSDGKTSELVYRWVLAMGNMRKRTDTDQNFVFATKGGTDINFNAEIYTIPGTPDADSFNSARRTQAQTMGVSVWMLGTHKAKEEILRRVALEGSRDRYYHCDTAYGNYEEQMLSCVKRIVSGNQVMRYELKPGQRKEALDCEGLALHASYAMGYRLWTDSQWQQIERHLTRV